MVNYKISVIGEVTRPGTFTISNEKVNLLEALAMAGDMTVYGLRDNVKLIREDANGKQQIVTLDLNKVETILSPYYWLQQNDIVYVTPNKAKAPKFGCGQQYQSLVLCYFYFGIYRQPISKYFKIMICNERNRFQRSHKNLRKKI